MGPSTKPVQPLRSTHLRRFDVGVDALWSAVTSVDRYQRWWPWLTELDAPSFEAGARWHCEVRAPLRYRVRFDLLLDEVDPIGDARRARATVTGDIDGTATLAARAVERGSELELVATLAPTGAALRRFTHVARPLAAWSHDWVLDTGLRQFGRRALGPHA